ncbi:ApeP family dehydratase [Kangiella aquimarina]|uniref:3-hydroxyacyl-ACP dehydratase n=1 Tax=Kangiella aquimarina TaxID=261965 RepID=A0ABZ0X5M5_9GAMM|nr:hypothetical protein [Kangiella aquimarina]WQG85683.1 3-hydroxyacyl-ACP dehydratase [Kangiella aquimarina]
MQSIEAQKPIILSKPVSEFVPHSAPMVLIDKIVDFDESSLVAEFSVSAESRFFQTDIPGIESWVGVEYMAQAIAALAGIRAFLVNQPVNLGFLLGTRKLELFQQQFNNNQTYTVQIKELYMDDSGLGSFDCSIVQNNQCVCAAKLNVFETSDQTQLLN